MSSIRIGVVVTFALAGCTIRHAAPLAEKPEALCIQKNPAVIVPNFLPILQGALQEHGVQTKAVTKDLSDCPLVLTYDARQGWDMDNFVRFIELEVTRPNGTLVGRSWWKTRGGFGLNKFAPTEVKVARVVDDLLTCAPPCSRSTRVPSPSYPAIWNLYQ